MDDNKRWFCLDCGRNTFEGNENYYFLKDRLWRELVAREQRHRMICRPCIERRLGRPITPDDLKTASGNQSEPEDQPMEESDYGVYDSLTPRIIEAIDSAIIEFAASRPCKVSAIVGYMYAHAPTPIPALHDWFYMNRIADLIDGGELAVVFEGTDVRFHTVIAARPQTDCQNN
jgi:hypothetical protein